MAAFVFYVFASIVFMTTIVILSKNTLRTLLIRITLDCYEAAIYRIAKKHAGIMPTSETHKAVVIAELTSAVLHCLGVSVQATVRVMRVRRQRAYDKARRPAASIRLLALVKAFAKKYHLSRLMGWATWYAITKKGEYI